jgi:DNA-binding MarR family transcriptional regulator
MASELRVVLGQLLRRMRADRRFSGSSAAVLGRLDRDGPQCVSDLALAEHMRPQSMAQTVHDLTAEGLLRRSPDPSDRRRTLVDLTEEGRAALYADRRDRDSWLAKMISEDLTEFEQESLVEAVELLKRIAAS